MRAFDMQERTNKRLLVSLLLLIAATGFAYWFIHLRSDAALDKTIFRLDDYRSVDRVVLEQQGKTTELRFHSGRWKVNDTLDADRNLIQVLFATLQQVEPKRPVQGAAADSLKAEVEANGVTVSLFSGESLRQRFYAGGNESQTQAYFSDGDGIYVMHIPGYRVYASGIFELGAHQWRDKYVFGFNWRNFRELRSEFPGRPDENFRVTLGGNNVFGVEGMPEADTARLNTFLDEVSLLTVDEYRRDERARDSLLAATPRAVITISDLSGETYSLRLFGESGSEVLALLAGNDLAVISRMKANRVIRPRSFFRSR